jgi:hypothetical protein
MSELTTTTLEMPEHISEKTGAPAKGLSVAVAAGLAAGAMLTARPARAAHTFAGTPLTFNNIPGTGDVKILNYALALEDFEADFYDQLLKRLTTGGRNAYGETIVGLNLRGIDVDYVRRFGRVEAEHRDFLRSTLRSVAGEANVIQPFRYDFGLGSTDPNPLTRQQLIDLLLDIERTGVAAYLGAVPFFSSRSPFRQTAVAIQGTEARHTSVITIVTNILFNAQRNVAPVQSALSSPARNDIDPFGREVTQNPQAPSTPLMPTPSTGQVFEAQPDTPARPDQVLRKVSPFIVRPGVPNVS